MSGEACRSVWPGDVVWFWDNVGVRRRALVSAVWSETMVNVVYIPTPDEMGAPHNYDIQRYWSVEATSVPLWNAERLERNYCWAPDGADVE